MKKRAIGIEFFEKNLPPPSDSFVKETMTRLNLMALEEEKPMKRKGFTTVLVMGLILILLCGVALAVTLSRSEKSDATMRAREALMEKYGISTDTMGMLYASATQQQDGKTIITFEGVKYNGEAIGVYTATIDGDKTDVTWSHDNVDEKLWKNSDDLTSPAWGAGQLERALEIDRAYFAKEAERTKETNMQEWTVQEWAEQDAPLAEADKLGLNVWFYRVAPGPDDIQEDEALKMARDTIIKTYGVDEKYLDDYKLSMQLMNYAYRDEKMYQVNYYIEDEKTHTLEHAFNVNIYTPSGKIEYCGWNVPAQERTLPEGSLKAYKQAIEEYMERGAFDVLTAAEKAALDARIRETGYETLLDGRTYVAPEAGELSDADALSKAEAVLFDAFGFPKDALILFTPSVSMQDTAKGRAWVIDFNTESQHVQWSLGEDTLGFYRVALDAKTGEKIEAIWSLEDQKSKETYTETTWGQAPVFDAKLLSYVMELYNDLLPLYEKNWDATQMWSDEDYAAHDQRYRDAGFDPRVYSQAMPDESAIAKEKAVELARAALKEEFKVEDARLDSMMLYAMYSVGDSDQPSWRITFMSYGGQEHYSVSVDAGTGMILYTDYAAAGNG